MKLDKQTRKYLSEIGRKGGQKSSAQKAKAARSNGKLGGRPPKTANSAAD